MKKVLFLLLCLLISVSLFSFDFGCALGNSSNISGIDFKAENLSLSQSDTFTAWFKTPFNDNVSLAAEGYILLIFSLH